MQRQNIKAPAEEMPPKFHTVHKVVNSILGEHSMKSSYVFIL